MSHKQTLAIQVAQQRLDNAVKLSKECADETGQTPNYKECSRVRTLAGKISVLTNVHEGVPSVGAAQEADHCPSMNSPRCPLYQDIEVEFTNNVESIDSRRAS